MTTAGLRVSVVRTGGVAGMALRVSMDSSELDPAGAAALLSTVDALGADPGGPRLVTPGGGRGVDRFRYDILVIRGENEQRISGGEDELPEAARSLVRHLLEHGRRA